MAIAPVLPINHATTHRDSEGEGASLLAEVAFATLPLLVIFLVSLADHEGTLYSRLSNSFSSPEWSFGSAVLLGQTLAKLIGGVARGGHVRPGAAQLVVALVLVFGLAPVLMILYFMLEHEHRHDTPGILLKLSQIIYFAFSAFSYVIMGGVSAKWRKQ